MSTFSDEELFEVRTKKNKKRSNRLKIESFKDYWDKKKKENEEFQGVSKYVPRCKYELKMPTKVPKGLFRKALLTNYQSKNIKKSNNKIKKPISIKPIKIRKIKYIPKDIYCIDCKKEIKKSWHEHKELPSHRINVLINKRNESSDDEYYKIPKGYRLMKKEELGKDGKPKKKFRRSKKIIRSEARESLLDEYLIKGDTSELINRNNYKFINKEEAPIKPDIKYRPDILEPHEMLCSRV